MTVVSRNVYVRCTTHPTLNGLIEQRCYPIRLPASVTLPAITYSQLSDDDWDYRAHGEGTERTVSRISFNCWGETFDSASDVADALVAAWTGYSLPPEIGWSQILLRLDGYDEPLGRYRIIVDVTIEHAR